MQREVWDPTYEEKEALFELNACDDATSRGDSKNGTCPMLRAESPSSRRLRSVRSVPSTPRLSEARCEKEDGAGVRVHERTSIAGASD